MKNQNTKLVLSADFELAKVCDMLGPAALEAYPELGKQYALIDKFQDATYLVNESIYYFLSMFSSPAPLCRVYAELAADDASVSQVARFIHELREKEILVTPEQNNAVAEQIAKEEEIPLPDVARHGVVKVLKHARHVWIGLVNDEARPEPYVLKKVLLPSWLSETERVRRTRDFAHEVAMHQAAGAHPNIVTLYGADMEKHEMMLEYVKGESIRKFVKNSNPTMRECCRLMAKILTVFEHLHANGVLHGDIHSSNFLVTDQKEPMLFDFDMARSDGGNARRKAAKIGGVYPYAPPERISTAPLQIFNRKQTSRTAEVYQLGIICYLLLYHELPFEGATWKNLSGSILNVPPVWNPKTPGGESIPVAMVDVLRKALEKNPADRYATVREFASAWARICEFLRTDSCN